MPAGVGAPLLDEGLGLVDLAAPLLGRPVGDRAVARAEVAVEVGAYLVALEPGAAHVGERGLDVLVGEVADVGGAARVVRRVVQALLRLGQQIEAGEEEGHARAVLLGEVEEAGEQAVAHLARAVPGEDHELRRGLARLQRHRLGGLLGLRTGEGRGAVTDGLGARLHGLGGAAAGVSLARTAGGARLVRAERPAPRESYGRRGARTDSERAPSSETPHCFPIRRVLCGLPVRGRDGQESSPRTMWVAKQMSQSCHQTCP